MLKSLYTKPQTYVKTIYVPRIKKISKRCEFILPYWGIQELTRLELQTLDWSQYLRVQSELQKIIYWLPDKTHDWEPPHSTKASVRGKEKPVRQVKGIKHSASGAEDHTLS